MIGYLRGKNLFSDSGNVIIDVGGVGYKVALSANSFEHISGREEIELFIYTNVKEDSIQLFGFAEKSEMQMFELLISINGIGPKLALTILSGVRAPDLQSIIASGNYDRLTSIPGIGRKTAERIILELRGKVEKMETDNFIAQPGTRGEAIKALLSLGYNAKVAERAVREVLEHEPGLSIEELIRSAIKKAFS